MPPTPSRRQSGADCRHPTPGDICDGRKKALFIAVPEVPDADGYEILGQPLEDISRLMKLFTAAPFGFAPTDIATLCGPQATNEAILSAIRSLIRGTGEGDIRVFAFTGHGSQVHCVHQTETDEQDEVILPYDAIYEKDLDGKGGKIKNGILDNELHRELVLSLGKGCRLLSVVDACYSGTSLDLPFSYSWNNDTGTWDLTQSPMRKFFDFLATSSRSTSLTTPSRGPPKPRRKGAGWFMGHVTFVDAQDKAEVAVTRTSVDRKPTGEIVITDDSNALGLEGIPMSSYGDSYHDTGSPTTSSISYQEKDGVNLPSSLSRRNNSRRPKLLTPPQSEEELDVENMHTPRLPRKAGSSKSRKSMSSSYAAANAAMPKGVVSRAGSGFSRSSTQSERSNYSRALSPARALARGDDFRRPSPRLLPGTDEYDSPDHFEDVTCLSSSTDHQRSWESAVGHTLVVALAEVLTHNPTPTYCELLGEISKRMEQWSNARKEANSSGTLPAPSCSDASDTQSIASAVSAGYTQTPLLSSSRRKSVDEILLLF